MNRHAHALCFAAALVLAQAPVLANTFTASATISNLQLTLTDLVPDDGVQASLTELNEPPPANFLSSADVHISTPWSQYAQDRQIGTSWLGRVAASTTLDQSSAQASVSHAAALTGPYTITATGSLVDLPSGNALSLGYYMLSASAGSPSGTRALFLSPHTQLTLTASADLAISTPGLDLALAPSRGRADSAYDLTLTFSRITDAQPLDLGFSDALTLYGDSPPRSETRHQDITRTLTNDTDQFALVYLGARTTIAALAPHSMASPVPEAASGLLWLLGLGGLGFAVRRRA